MSDAPLQFTMRELQRIFFSPRFWATIVGVAVVLGLAGPFGTYDGLAAAPRVAYWLAIAVTTYLVGFGVTGLCAQFLLLHWPLPTLLAYALAGAAAGVPVTLVVLAINRLVYGEGGIDTAPAALLVYCMAISATVSGLVAMFSIRHEDSGEAAPLPRRPRILERLPHGLRGELSHITVQDHYVDIRTDRGGALVLMRLADAIAETEGVEGLRIHRSHWVAKDAVERAVRKDGRLFLKLRDGTMLPVSRSYAPAVRAAGLG